MTPGELAEHDREGPPIGRTIVERRRTSPRRRPPSIARAGIGLLGLAAMAFAAALMLSDRAPGVIRYVLGDDTRRLWDRIDASGRASFATEGELPPPDFLAHVVVWAVVTALAGLAVWTWRGLAVTAGGVLAGSIAVEFAQGWLSSTRSVEFDDVVANSVGVALGACSAGLVFAAWSVLSLLLVSRS